MYKMITKERRWQQVIVLLFLFLLGWPVVGWADGDGSQNWRPWYYLAAWIAGGCTGRNHTTTEEYKDFILLNGPMENIS